MDAREQLKLAIHGRRALCAAAVSLLLAPPAALADRAAADEPANYQVFLGVLDLDDQTGRWDDISDEPVDVDFSSLPSGGIEAEYIFHRGYVHVGLNPGGSIAWKSDDTRFAGGFTEDTGGVLAVDVDNSLFIAELHLGGYVRGRLHERITAYAAGGPMLAYGYHEVEDEQVDGRDGDLDLDDTDSDDVNVGFYARAGIDFELADHNLLGFGLRYLSTELDFDRTVGNLDITGPQYVLTYTQRL